MRNEHSRGTHRHQVSQRKKDMQHGGVDDGIARHPLTHCPCEKPADETGLKTMKQKNNETAVSPVIGVIIMIAVSIILAAMVAAFVFGNFGSQKEMHYISVKPEHTGDGIMLTLYKSEDLYALDKLTVKINGVDKGTWVPATVGETKLFAGTYNGVSNKLEVVADYKDGSSMVVLNVLV